MPLQNAPVIEAQMLVRRPVAVVFEAFVDPAITTKHSGSRRSASPAASSTSSRITIVGSCQVG